MIPRGLDSADLRNSGGISSENDWRDYRVNWLDILESLNRKGESVWSPIVLGGKIIGVRKIRFLKP